LGKEKKKKNTDDTDYWSFRNGTKLNSVKCKVMHLRTNKSCSSKMEAC